ncbi:hypothetical protein [Salinigranum marinum]|uniref:hypothetical protein n=1 Tax=Salinigranum marinum TaxID=1515595 RepID=UPI002989D31F|nr:hypothetical protein [Salinigranum marinum]
MEREETDNAERGTGSDQLTGVTRRRLLRATASAGVTASLAGCGGVTRQTFTAVPAGLTPGGIEQFDYPSADHEELSETRRRSVAGEEIEITAESHLVAYGVADERAADAEGESPALSTRWRASRRRTNPRSTARRNPSSSTSWGGPSSDYGRSESSPADASGLGVKDASAPKRPLKSMKTRIRSLTNPRTCDPVVWPPPWPPSSPPRESSRSGGSTRRPT